MSMHVDGNRPTGVVVMAYGTPATPEDVPAYYTHIRRGRPPTDEQLANLTARYDALGGVSQLAARTEAQRARLAEALQVRRPGGFRVVTGQRHAAPFIADAVDALAKPTDGSLPPERIVGIVLAPHYSGFSIGHYRDQLAEAATAHGIDAVTIPHWYDLPEYTAFLATAVREAIDGLGTAEGATEVVFTAHSLPERLLVDDPYPEQLSAGAASIAHKAGLDPESGWSIAWQSAGATDDAWRGPDIRDVIREVAASGRAEGVVVCPHGFTSDHLEVCYDLDIEARRIADEVGVAFTRTRVLNDDAAVFRALAEWVELTAGTP
jgi:ferrochelatase